MSTYIKIKCNCGRENFVKVKQKVRTYYENGRLVDFEYLDPEPVETVYKPDLVAEVLQTIGNYLFNGITIKKLCKMLHDAYGIAEEYCCDFIQRIKLDLCMYCPDRCHLYFVDEEKQVQKI